MISIILVNWNGWADTIECIQSLLDSIPTEARIIVVDNASSDGSIEIFRNWSARGLDMINFGDFAKAHDVIAKNSSRNCQFIEYDEHTQCFSGVSQNQQNMSNLFAPVYFVRGSRNRGFGAGCNIGMRLSQHLGTEVIWLLNNDCVVSPIALIRLHERVRQCTNSMVGVHLKYYYEPRRFQAVGGGTLSRVTGKFQLQTDPASSPSLGYIHGASMAFSSHCAEKVGYFDEKIFMYCEEVDYCLRARLLGFEFEVLPVEVFHKEGGSQGGGVSVNAWSQVLINKYYVLRKNLGWGPWVLFFFAMLLTRSLLPVGKKVEQEGARRALHNLFFGA